MKNKTMMLGDKIRTLVRGYCRVNDLIEVAIQDLLDKIEEEPTETQAEIAVHYDLDAGWVIEEPVDGDLEYRYPCDPATKKSTIEEARDLARERGMPLYIFNRKGRLEKVEVPR